MLVLLCRDRCTHHTCCSSRVYVQCCTAVMTLRVFTPGWFSPRREERVVQCHLASPRRAPPPAKVVAGVAKSWRT